MMSKRFALILAATAILGCGHEKKSNSVCVESGVPEFVYDGLASDETCKALLDAEDAAVLGGPNAPHRARV